MTPLGAIKPSQ